MLISMNWIQDFVDLSGLDLDQLIQRFTLSTAEVEEVFHKGRDIEKVVAGKILSVDKHPNSKKLHLLKVDTGSGVVDCVCGAPNVREGMLVPFACAGGRVCAGEIGKATVAGYPSEGMCCSESELGISADHSGLMELPEDTVPGTDIKKLYAIEDTVFEVDNKSLTNRPDLWGHYGIAREFAALAGRPLRPMDTADSSRWDALPAVSIDIEDKELAYRYTGLRVDNVTVKHSPVNMRIRLFYCGSRGINLLTDLTNYLMLEMGQPMHAFDARRVSKVEVRRFPKSFTFRTLDGVDREIDENTLMICSGGEPVAIAGVMGGEGSMTMDDTTSLLLESANFDGVSVRKTSTRLGLRTDASIRYEKILDPEMTPDAIRRYVKLLEDIDAGARVVSRLSDVKVRGFNEVTLAFDQAFVDRYTGIAISGDEIEHTLTALGFGVQRDGDRFTVEVPSWRRTKDVTIKADIIEEITRIYGYDNFEIKTTKSPLRPVLATAGRVADTKTKDLLADKFAMHEVHSYLWCDAAKFKEIGIPVEDNVQLANTMSPDHKVLRNSLIPTLLVMAAENKSFSDHYGIFEIARVIEGRRTDGTCDEHKKLGLVLYSRVVGEKELFFEMKKRLCTLASVIKDRPLEFVRTEQPAHSWQHPRNTAVIRLNGEDIGFMSVVHPNVKNRIDKKAALLCAEWDMEAFSRCPAAEPRYVDPSRYPGIDVDLTFQVERGVPYADLEKLLRQEDSELLKSHRLTDVYSEEDGRDSVTLRLEFSSQEKTLAREEVQPVVDRMVDRFEQQGFLLKR